MSDGAAPKRTPRRLVLVVGIGRSGSSLFAAILSRLGFHVPQPEVTADETNPRGFSEPRWVVDFHTRLMRQLRVRRFDSRPEAWRLTAAMAEDARAFADLRDWLTVQLVGVENVVVKDPRIDWFLPLWLRCAEELGVETSFATMLRHPAEVVRSARDSYGTWQTDASRAASWLNATLHTEHATRAGRRAFVRYDALLEAWPREVARVAELLGFDWLQAIERSRRPEVDELVDPTLRRANASWVGLDVPATLRPLLEETWRQASQLPDPGGDNEAVRASLDELRASYLRLYADAEAIAQSSLLAARPQRGGALGRAGKAGRSALPRTARRFAARGFRSLPARHRHRARRAASGAWLGVGILTTLPLRLALLIPPRYRERVPLPVARLGLRMIRTRRRY
jgi:hypothetical protein